MIEVIEGYQSFVWCPVGDVLALIDRGGGFGCPPVGRVSVMDVGTGDVRDVVEVSVGEVAWSPDGGNLAFTTQVTGSHRTADLRVVDLVEGNVDTLVEGSVSGVRWSPEGDRIAFVRTSEDDTRSELVIGTTGGEGVTIQSPLEGGIAWFEWSPDGDWIAYTTFQTDFKGNRMDYELWLALAEGGVSEKLFGALNAIDIPKWSPDGGTILFDVWRDGASNVYAVDADDSTSIVRLAEGRGAEWSPDGEAIAFIASWCGTFDVTVMSADGTGPTNLTPSLPGFRLDVEWSPDGERVAFGNYTQEEERGLYTVGRDGSELMRVAEAIVRVEWSGDGQYLAGVDDLGFGVCE